MIALWLAIALAADPSDVRRELSSGVFVNWSTLTLEAEAAACGGATESTRAVEELARREADAAIRLAVGRVRVSTDRTVADLQRVPEFGPPIDARVSRWRAQETRYYASGRVEVDAWLSLVDLLKPYTLATAADPEPTDQPQPAYTGVVIDARGTSVEPAWSPRVLSERDEVLYDGRLSEEAAVERAPVLYVSDPAHPAAVRAGDSPIFLVADSAQGPDLQLTAADAQRFRTALQYAAILGQGTVVVVVDP